MSEFSEKLKEIMVLKKISNRTLANKTGITEVSIGRYVNGHRVPKATEIIKIAEALNVSIDEILQTDKQVTLEDVIMELGFLSNRTDIPISECLEYHRAKMCVMKVIEKLEKNYVMELGDNPFQE